MGSPCSVSLRFADGVEQRVPVAPGQSVLDAALAAGAPVLNQCRSGSCGSCVARLAEGDARMRSGAASSLLPGEQAQGQRLLCLTEAHADSAFEFAYDSQAAAGGPVSASAFVDAIERIAPDAVRLKLELAEGDWFDFQPGQFIELTVPGTDARRRYSMASSPADLPSLELLVRLLPSGAMSDYLRDRARVDDVIPLTGPYGAFFLREKVKAPHIMIAGGTGLAPMMSMLDAIRARPGIKPPVLLSFGCATPGGLFNLEELELRGHWMPGLRTLISVDAGEPGAQWRIGNPVDAISAEDVRNPASVAYLCGPPGMVRAARAHLERLGLAPANIHAEQFVASE